MKKSLVRKRAVIKRKITVALASLSEESTYEQFQSVREEVVLGLEEVKLVDEEINNDLLPEAEADKAEELSEIVCEELGKQTEYLLSVKSKLKFFENKFEKKTENGKVENVEKFDLKLPELKCDSFSGENCSNLQYHNFKSSFNNVIGNRLTLSKST